MKLYIILSFKIVIRKYLEDNVFFIRLIFFKPIPVLVKATEIGLIYFF
jgi:hypothetical protein